MSPIPFLLEIREKTWYILTLKITENFYQEKKHESCSMLG